MGQRIFSEYFSSKNSTSASKIQIATNRGKYYEQGL